MQRTDIVKTLLNSDFVVENFRDEPLGLVEIGARWGIDERFREFASVISAVAIEPDPEEAAELREDPKANWNQFLVLEEAIGAKEETVSFHLAERANNSSILSFDTRYKDRYPLPGLDTVSTFPVHVKPLDLVLPTDKSCEILKMDVQGFELDVIKGAESIISEQTACVFCEVSFFPLYKNSPLFSDIELTLRKMGFQFYGFMNLQHRAAKMLDKSQTLGKERLIQADALFLKDPLEPGQKPLSSRSINCVLLAALFFGFHDLAMEIVKRHLPDHQRAECTSLIEALAKSEAEECRQIFSNTVSEEELNHVSLGKLVDGHRDNHTFWDLKK